MNSTDQQVSTNKHERLLVDTARFTINLLNHARLLDQREFPALVAGNSISH